MPSLDRSCRKVHQFGHFSISLVSDVVAASLDTQGGACAGLWLDFEECPARMESEGACPPNDVPTDSDFA